jgi:hypothetical protein
LTDQNQNVTHTQCRKADEHIAGTDVRESANEYGEREAEYRGRREDHEAIDSLDVMSSSSPHAG